MTSKVPHLHGDSRALRSFLHLSSCGNLDSMVLPNNLFKGCFTKGWAGLGPKFSHEPESEENPMINPSESMIGNLNLENS